MITRSFGGVPMQLLPVPAGERASDGLRGRLAPFWIGRFPVTVAQHRAFLCETGRDVRAAMARPPAEDDLPVTGVSWAEACAFGAWASGPAELVRLPTELEWEHAARGPHSWDWPWGDEPPTVFRAWWVAALGGVDRRVSQQSAAEAALPRPQGPLPVGSCPEGASRWSGAEDLAGNVWEWCADPWSDPPRGPRPDAPERAPRVIRGGGWFSASPELRCDAREPAHPDMRRPDLGFRVVLLRRAAIFGGG